MTTRRGRAGRANSDCKCRVCVRAERLIDLAKRAGGVGDMAFVQQIDSELACAETDSVYWRMKYEGTWRGYMGPPDCHDEPGKP